MTLHSPTLPPSSYRGMRFFENDCNEGGKFLLEKRGKSGIGAGGIAFKMGGCETFDASLNLYINGRGVLTPYFKKTAYIAYPPNLFHILSNPSTSLSPPTPTHCSFHCPVSLAEWVITPHLIYYFT